jgi:hypothetical protein
MIQVVVPSGYNQSLFGGHMSRFVKINDKPLERLRMEEFTDFFTEHIFFKFMDGGRVGIQVGVQDLVDNSIARTLAALPTNIDKRIRPSRRLQDPALTTKLYDYHLPRIVSAFINGGTKEMHSAIFSCATDPLMFE